MKIEFKNIDTVLVYTKNTKKHPAKQIDKLAESIKLFGLAGPVIIRNNIIAKGHCVLKAVKKLYTDGVVVTWPPGLDGHREPFIVNTIPTLDASGWSEQQFKAFVIADNKLAESEWNYELLKEEIINLEQHNFDISWMGLDFSDSYNELSALTEQAVASSVESAFVCPHCGREII
jgi:ParB-like chromosome segregation protein Spo0J